LVFGFWFFISLKFFFAKKNQFTIERQLELEDTLKRSKTERTLTEQEQIEMVLELSKREDQAAKRRRV
jgi:hypothetical protein